MKLSQRGFNSEDTEAAVARLEELEYLESEPTLALAYAKELFRRKGMSPRRAQDKLRQKGFNAEHSAEAVKTVFEEWDGVAAALQLARPGEPTERLVRRLSGRGFPSSVLSRVVRALNSGSVEEE